MVPRVEKETAPGDTGCPRPSYFPPTRNKREVASGKAALGRLTKREGRLAESLCLRLRWCVGFEKRGSPGYGGEAGASGSVYGGTCDGREGPSQLEFTT